MKRMVRIALSVLLTLVLIGAVAYATDTAENGSNRAELHIAYLGSGDTPSPTALEPDTSDWKEGVEFWIGVYMSETTRMDNAVPEGMRSHIFARMGDSVDGGIYSTAVGLEYASLYLTPVSLEAGDEGYTGTNADQKTFLKNALYCMPKWSALASNAYDAIYANYDERQLDINGSELSELAPENRPKLMYLNMKSQSVSDRVFYDHLDDEPMYLLVAKFRIKAMPNEGVQLFSLKLDPVHFAIQTGSSGSKWRSQWNVDRTVTPDNNLKNHIDYISDLEFKFVAVDVTELDNGKYSTSYVCREPSFEQETLIGELPPGLTYERGTYSITGTCTQAGKYIFRIGTRYYSITVDKAPLTVSVDSRDTSRVYGYPNPDFRLVYSGFTQGEDQNSPSFTNDLVAPTITCEADASTPTGKVPITLSGGSATNYEFVYQDSELTITPRTLNVTAINSVPNITSTSPLTLKATATSSQFTSGELRTGDYVTLTFDVAYPDNQVSADSPFAEKTVTISNVAIAESGAGGNYVLGQVPTTAIGTVDNRNVSSIELTTPPKMEYIYGEPLDLSDMRLTVYYEAYPTPTVNLSYSDLLARMVDVEFVKNGVANPAQEGDILSVMGQNGAVIRFSANGKVWGQTEAFHVTPLELKFTIMADSREYDGTTKGTGTIKLLNTVQDDDVTASGTFTFSDASASNRLKTVDVTNIKLSGADAGNYTIASTAQAQAQIVKVSRPDEVPMPEVTVDPLTNNIQVVSPVNQEPEEGEEPVSTVEYEYTIDGGSRWQASPLFTDLVQGNTYRVQARIRGNDNHNASSPSPAAEVKVFDNRVSLYITESDNTEMVARVFTDLVIAETKSDLDNVFTLSHGYQGYWLDKDYVNETEFPYTLLRDTRLYVKTSSTEGSIIVIKKQYSTWPDRIFGEAGDRPVQILLSDENGEVDTMSNIRWESTNVNVATVDNMGNVTLVHPGTAMILIFEKGMLVAQVEVAVREPGLVDRNFSGAYIVGYPDGSFRPDSPVTRAEIAAVLNCVLKNDLQTEEQISFTDVSADAWYADAILRLARLNVFNGYPDGTFNPDGELTRAEIAVIVCKMVNLEPMEGECKFTDCGDMWATPYINAATAYGFLNGYPDGTFRPDAKLTRVQLTVVMNNLVNAADVDNDQQLRVPTDMNETHWAYDNIIRAMNTRISM